MSSGTGGRGAQASSANSAGARPSLQQAIRQKALGLLEGLPEEEARSLLIKCWMSHDARWFTAVAMNAGLDVAQRCNRTAIHDEGRVEAKRILPRLQLGAIRSVDDFLLAQEALIGVLGPDLLDYDLVEGEGDRFDLIVQRCFAFDNVTRAGIAGEYECGILPRLTGWLEGLEIEYALKPEIGRCLKAQGKECRYAFTLRFHDPTQGAERQLDPTGQPDA